jgi:hypothetical protein
VTKHAASELMQLHADLIRETFDPNAFEIHDGAQLTLFDRLVTRW